MMVVDAGVGVWFRGMVVMTPLFVEVVCRWSLWWWWCAGSGCDSGGDGHNDGDGCGDKMQWWLKGCTGITSCI